MSLGNKKKLFRGGAAIASIAGIGYFVKQFLDQKKEDNCSTNKCCDDKQNANKLNRVSQPLPKDYLGVKLELTDYYENLLKELPEPKLVYKHFMTCLSTPRPSGKLDKMRAAIKKTADLLNLEYTQDKIGNVVLKKKGSKGYENATGVVIQCHMDMVTTKTDDCKFDFDNDPIRGYIDDDGEWLKAKNTTLGADDGIGIAAGLALMEHPNLVHGPIELLITVDEETNMGGAINLETAPFLQNKVLINVDSEEDHRICIGCAGGFNKFFSVNMNRSIIKNDDNGYKVYSINISGLCGGHTGIQIQLERANAIQLLCRILNYLMIEKKMDLQLVEINGGNALNAIPSYSHCGIVIKSELSDQFEEAIQEYWMEYILNEFKDIEKKMHIDCKEVVDDFSFQDTKICDVKSTKILVSLMMNLPHGVLRWSPSVDGLVQTSIAFSKMNMDKNADKAECGLFARSMSMNEMLELNRKIDSLKMLYEGDRIEVGECKALFPGWEPVTTSAALDHCKNAHIALFNETPDVYAVHAGLECGLIKDKYPKMDCISIGPHIKGAHSPDERLELKTVNSFYDWLTETVTRIAMQKM